MWSGSFLGTSRLSYKNQLICCVIFLVRVCKTLCCGHITSGVSVRYAVLLLDQFVPFAVTFPGIRSGIYIKISSLL